MTERLAEASEVTVDFNTQRNVKILIQNLPRVNVSVQFDEYQI